MRNNKLLRPALLMLLSQLLLTLFVAWWLGRQYNNEKDELVHELSRRFAETERQVGDSVIFKHFVKPFDTIREVTRNFKMQTFQRIPHFSISNDSAEKKHTVISLEISDSSSHNMTYTQVGPPEDNRKKIMSDMLIGLKMFVKGQPGDTGSISFDYSLSLEADSVLFKRMFEQQVGSLGLKAQWIKRQKNTEGKMILQSMEMKRMPAVQLTGYSGYLLQRIWPQLVFGLLLVLLTATAFLVAYRSIRSQHRLHQLREDFISNISHELKTPLSTARVTIESLKTFDAERREKHMKEYLDIAEQELGRLDELVTKVLHTGMPETGEGFIRKQLTEAALPAEEVVQAARVRMKNRPVQISLDAQTRAKVNLDPLHVHGVLYNMVDNAVKYNTSGAPQVHITVAEENGFVTISVKDNGPGIHEEYIGRVFDKFFRIPTGNVHNVKGHGLGLSYARQVMLKHDGRITVHNNPGGGCTFTLYFPKAQ